MKDNIFDVVSQYRKLKDDSFFRFDKGENYSRKSSEELKNLKDKFDQYKDKIKQFGPDNINKCKSNIINVLDYLIKVPSINKIGHPISRSQGLSIPNYIFGKVISDIYWSLTNPVEYPKSNFYYQVNGDFDYTIIKEKLEKFLKDLNSKEFDNYFAFEDYVEQFLDELRKMWNNENKKTKYGSTK